MLFWLTISLFAVIFYLLDKHFLSYWSKRGFDYAEPTFLVGNFADQIKGRKTVGAFFADVYKKYKNSKLLGFYFSYRPALIINDPEYIQDILIKDFTAFHDRGLPVNEKKNPLSAHLFTLEGQKWRDLRVKLSPTFTSGKLKGMYSTIRDCAKVLEDYLIGQTKNGKDTFEFRDLLARFTTNVISSVAFGIENDCINDPENIFRKMGIKIFETSFKRRFIRILTLVAPKLLSPLNLKSQDEEMEKFFFDLVRTTIDYRSKNKNEQQRKDFMNLLIQLKDQGYVSVDKNEEYEAGDKQVDFKKLTLNQVAAQTFLFFIAGFETSSSTMNFSVIELCKNQKIQQKAQKEIDDVVKGGEISYENLNELKYLDMIVDETLRKYPIVPILNREASRDYQFAHSNLVVEKGTAIIIPVLGIHRDANIYENPLEFKPERFSDSPSGNSYGSGLTYFGFGDGPSKF